MSLNGSKEKRSKIQMVLPGSPLQYSQQVLFPEWVPWPQAYWAAAELLLNTRLLMQVRYAPNTPIRLSLSVDLGASPALKMDYKGTQPLKWLCLGLIWSKLTSFVDSGAGPDNYLEYRHLNSLWVPFGCFQDQTGSWPRSLMQVCGLQMVAGTWIWVPFVVLVLSVWERDFPKL